MQVSLDMLKDLQQCGNAAEIVAKAKIAGVDITEEQASALLNADLNSDINLGELDTIAGGGLCNGGGVDPCPNCGSTDRYVGASGDNHCKNCSYVY